MKITTKTLPKSELLLVIETEAKDLEKYKDLACKEISAEVKVDGFRPGHVPYNILVERVGEDYIKMMTEEKAASKLYIQALEQEKLIPLGSADFKVTSQDPFTFEIKIAVKPEVEIKDLDKIHVKKEKIEVTEKDINEVIENLKKQKSTWKDVEGKASKGHRVEVDFDGFDSETNETLENTHSKNHPIVIGDNMFIPGFEDHLVDMAKDEEKEFHVTFPADYHHDKMKNKKVKFKVKVNRIEERISPEVNEDFIAEMVGEKISEEEFKKRISESLIVEKKKNEVSRQDDKFFEELLKHSDIEPSEILVNEELQYLLENYKENAKKYNLTWEKYLEIIKKKEDEVKDELRSKAVERVKYSFVVDKAFVVDDIDVKDEEVMKEIEDYIAQLPKKEQYENKKKFVKNGQAYRNLVYNMKITKLIKKHTEGIE